MLFSAAALFAQTVPGMIVSLTDSELKIALADVQNITYPSETTMQIACKSGVTQLTIDDIKNVTFAEIEGETSAISTVNATADATSYAVYDLNGALVKSGSLKTSLSSALTGVKAGNYIIIANGKTIKATKK